MKTIKHIVILFLFFSQGILFAQTWEENYELAKSSYINKDFGKAAKQLSDILNQNSNLDTETTAEIANLQAVCLLQNGKPQEAVNTFLSTIANLESQSGRAPSENYYTATSQLGTILYKANQGKNAIQYLNKAIAEADKLKKENNDELITLQQLIATIYKDGKEITKADSVYKKVLSLKSSLHGSTSEELRKTVITVAKMHDDNQNYDQAISYYLQASEITAESKGQKSNEYATINHKLAELYTIKGDLEGAESIHQKNIRIFKKEYGEKSPQYLSAYISLADLYMNTGRYNKAEHTYEDARALLKELIGEQNEEYARLLNQIGLLKTETGDYQQAVQFFSHSLGITANKLGQNHPEYATTLHNLAIAYQNMEELSDAERTYKTALQIREKTSGKNSAPYAESANSLAVFYIKMGRYTEALTYLKEAHEIVKELYGTSHIRYASSLTNLAHLFELNQEHDKAMEFYTGALTIFDQVLGTDHPMYGDALNNLAKLHMKERRYAEAEDLFKKYKSITKKKYGNGHIKYSIALTNLARLHEKQEDYKKAIKLYEEVRDIALEVSGNKSLHYNEAISNLARVETANNNIETAKKYWLEANQNYFHQITSYFPSMSEKEQARFYSKIRYHFTEFNMFASDYHKQSPDLLIHLFENQIKTKSMLFRSTSKLISNIRNSSDEKTKKLFSQWQSQKELLTKYYTDPSINVSKSKKDSLETSVNETEKLLSALSKEFKSFNDDKPANFSSIKSSLKNDEALVEIVRVEKFEFTKGGTRDTNNVYYLALIISPSASKPAYVFINNGKDLETFKMKYYRNATKHKVEDRKSYAMYWERIKEKLPDNTKTVYLCPDGVYNQINLSSIHNPATRQYILDEINIRYITNSRELIENRSSAKSKSISLFGNPDYDSLNKFFQKHRNAQHPSLSNLPGTKKEIDQIEKLMSNSSWSIRKLEKSSASESNLKAVKDAQVVHIASHGFFRENLDVNEDESEDHFINNPLLRSGIYLSNDIDQAPGSGDDGVLTAYEAMNLNLDNTELVVLSACETGLGEVKNGEGVYGLQRAIRVAGANSILISLWKVDDRATQILMTSFYKHWIESGSKYEALKSAQKEVRKEYEEPYYWGGFILVGK